MGCNTSKKKKKITLDIVTIISQLKKGNSSLRETDIQEAQKYLEKRGFLVQSLLGCGSFGAVMLAKNITNQE